MTFLSPDTRTRIAHSVAAMLAMPQFLACVAAEVDATFAENPALPPTEESRRIVWALALPMLSRAAEQKTNDLAA